MSLLEVVELDRVPPIPWKNGGGTTRDLLVWPSHAHWQLRISVASIERDGPFSDYKGFDRWFAVMRGTGVALQMGGERYEIRRGAPPLHFDGALAPMCWLLDDPTSDLNLLVPQGAGKAAMLDVAPGRDWVSRCSWRGVVTTDAMHLVVDDHVAAGTRGTALIWSADAAGQRWRLRPQHDVHAHAWWIEFQPRAGGVK
jgi:hypothetical protein